MRTIHHAQPEMCKIEFGTFYYKTMLKSVSNCTRKNWSGWCNVVRWTMPEQCCYQGSTTLVEFTVLMSIVLSIVVRCWQRTIVVTMLLEQELTIVDEKACWWLSTMIEQWLLTVNNCEQWLLTVVDNSCWESAAQHCWQGAAQHCNKLLTTLVRVFIFAPVMIEIFMWTT